MALQVWLPLNGDLKNKGCADVTVTNNGAVVDNNGKIGKCYKFTADDNNIKINNFMPILKNYNNYSLCAWIYMTSAATNHSTTILSSGNWNTPNANFVFALYNYSSGYTKLLVPNTHSWNTVSINLSNKLVINTWYHIAVAYDGTTTTAYVNGEVVGSASSGGICEDSNSDNVRVGGATYYDGFTLKGNINDVRIYDHCLSAAEVKEISRGLILHYKLDENFTGGINLIKDGWGGTGNWGTNTASTVSTDVPENTPYKNSYCNNVSKEYIPLISDHSYTISMYGKKDSSCTAPNWLVTLIPYDADKLQIKSTMIADYFRPATKTTLASELKNGDTVVHLTDASAWATSSGAYIAVFGYTNSLGYTYPDMVYTRKVKAFNTSSIDTTNNTITLSAVWDYGTIPAGTTVCRSTSGNGYWYPASKSTSSMTVDTWYFLSRIFIPNSVNYIKPAKYVRVYSTIYTGNWVSGLTLVDNTLSSSIHDTSGYNNNGTINGTLTLSTDSPRYEASTGFNGSTYIQSESPSTEVRSISLWVKWNSISTGQSVVFVDQKSRIGFGLTSNGILCSSNGVASTYYQKSLLSANTWYHFVIVNTGDSPTSTTRDLYINGIKQPLYSGSSNWTYSLDALQLGKRSTTSDGFDGQITDFRIYATALSADDIRQLYEVSAKIDNKYNTYAYEFVENDAKSITKQGLTKFNLEERNDEAKIYKTVNPNLLQGTVRDNIKYTRTSGMSTEFGPQFTPTEQLETNKYYTFSASVRGNANMNVYTLNTGGNVSFAYINKADISETEFKLLSVTFRVPGDRTINKIYPCSRYGEANTEVGDWFEFKANSIKLEEGTMCTPWIPAETDDDYRNYNNMFVANQFIEI